MRCLVTGAIGFVGRHLTNLLLARGDTVVGADWFEETAAPPVAFELRRVDITSASDLLKLVQEARPEQVYHLAAFASPLESISGQRAVYETNILGTLNLLDAVQRAAPAARVLLVGSVQCYGAPTEADLPFTEQQIFAPRNPYAVSKAAADLLGFQFFAAHGLAVIRARPANHTGPGQSPSYVCSDFARQAAAIELGLSPPELRVGNIGVSRDFCDVRDVVRAYVLLLEKGRAGEAYNIGSGRAVALNEIVGILVSFCSRPVQVIMDSTRVRADDAKSLYTSIDKIAAHTGWTPEYDLRTTLRDVFDYWKSVLGERGSEAGNTASAPM